MLETELDVGQPFGNVYEESKVAGEKLVHAATHLDAYTIFRPAIIVGDTDDGFSTTFHGFYTPLRLLSALAEFLPQELLLSINHLETLGLDGHERKNFVPVQWVSEAMCSAHRAKCSPRKNLHTCRRASYQGRSPQRSVL